MRASPDDERIIVTKLVGRCRLCGDVFPIGTRVLWSPILGTRCEESAEVGGEDQCVGRFFGPEESP